MADLDLHHDLDPSKLREKSWPRNTVVRAQPSGIPTRAEALALKKTTETKKQEARDAALRERNELAKQHAEKFFGYYPNPYYAGPQVGIFIGETWVGDAVTLEYTTSDNKSPLYGYMSRYFDAVAAGNVIVQGQFAIAYTGPAYLQKILEKYSRSEGASSMFPTKIADPIERAKRLFWKLKDVTETPVKSPLEYGMEEGVMGKIRSGFDLRIFYGAQEFVRDRVVGLGEGVVASGPIEVISDVHLIGRSIVIAPSGEPIAENYSFFAKSAPQRTSLRPSVPVPTLVDRGGNVPIASLGGRGETPVNQSFNIQTGR